MVIIDLIQTNKLTNLIKKSNYNIEDKTKENKESFLSSNKKIIANFSFALCNKVKGYSKSIATELNLNISDKLINTIKKLDVKLNKEVLMEFIINSSKKDLLKFDQALNYFNNENLLKNKNFSDATLTKNLITNLSSFFELENKNTIISPKQKITSDVHTEINSNSKINEMKKEIEYIKVIEELNNNFIDNDNVQLQFLASQNLKIDLLSFQQLEQSKNVLEIQSNIVNLTKNGVSLNIKDGLSKEDIEQINNLSQMINNKSIIKSNHLLNQTSNMSIDFAAKNSNIFEINQKNGVSVSLFLNKFEELFNNLNNNIKRTHKIEHEIS